MNTVSGHDLSDHDAVMTWYFSWQKSTAVLKVPSKKLWKRHRWSTDCEDWLVTPDQKRLVSSRHSIEWTMLYMVEKLSSNIFFVFLEDRSSLKHRPTFLSCRFLDHRRQRKKGGKNKEKKRGKEPAVEKHVWFWFPSKLHLSSAHKMQPGSRQQLPTLHDRDQRV